jgi:GGDEF domain-containing protein
MSSATDTFYRLGGDEFALLSSGLTETAAVSRAKEISDHISQPYTINNQLIKIATCVGIVLSDNERRSDYLYKFADLAFTKPKRRFAADQSLPSVDAAKVAGKQNP